MCYLTMPNIKLVVFAIQIVQCLYWTYYSLEKESYQIRLALFTLALFRSLEVILENQNQLLSLLSHYAANLAAVENLLVEDLLFYHNRIANLAILIFCIHARPSPNYKLLRLLVAYFFARTAIQLGLNYVNYNYYLEKLIASLLICCHQPDPGEPAPAHHVDEVRSSFQARNDCTITSQNCLQNVINIFPSGIVMINQNKQIEFINQRCLKLLEVQSQEDVLRIVNQAYRQSQSLQEVILLPGKQEMSFLDDFLSQHVNYPLHRSEDVENNGNSDLTLEFAYKLNYEFKSKNSKIKKIRIKIITSIQNQSPANSMQDKDIIVFILIKNISKQQQLKKLEQDLLFQNSLLRSFSHELRTPLNCSIQMLEMAKDKASPDVLQYIDYAATQNYLLIYQINDILDFAAFQCNQFDYQWRAFTLQETIDVLIQLYHYQCQQKMIILEFKYDKALCNQEIVSDQQRIMQVLVNLLNNSLKFTRQQGRITVIFEPDSHQSVQVTVIDNGSGIKKEKLDQISQQHIDAIQTQALGLGIRISSRIVQGLGGGVLEIYSKFGKGTKISFKIKDRKVSSTFDPELMHQHIDGQPIFMASDLPIQYIGDTEHDEEISEFRRFYDSSLNIQDSHQECTTRMMPRFLNSNNFSYYLQRRNCQCTEVLIVDDVPSNQVALATLFKRLDIRVEAAYDGEDALKKVRNKMDCCGTKYKLIMMDVEMPNMDGFQATKEILRIYEASIVMCSAQDNKEYIDQAKRLGMCETLIKPIKISDLKRLVKKYLSN